MSETIGWKRHPVNRNYNILALRLGRKIQCEGNGKRIFNKVDGYTLEAVNQINTEVPYPVEGVVPLQGQRGGGRHQIVEPKLEMGVFRSDIEKMACKF